VTLETHPALWVLVRMVLLGQAEVGLPDLTLIVPEDTHTHTVNTRPVVTLLREEHKGPMHPCTLLIILLNVWMYLFFWRLLLNPVIPLLYTTFFFCGIASIFILRLFI